MAAAMGVERMFGATTATSGRPDDVAKQGSVELVVQMLEEDIVLGRLHPRERLIEEDLCGRFAVSRHTMRLAFAELDRMGLVERPPNRGALVRSFSGEEVEQLYALRDLLEAAAAERIAFPVQQPDLDELRAIQEKHDAAVDADNFVGIFKFNYEFHRKLFSLCGNHYLADAIKTYAQRAHGIRSYALADKNERNKACKEHHKMIKALENADRRKLVSLCRDHLPASKDAYLRVYGTIVS
jgi:DNA-binding GntR family transcriptional regulator